MCTCFEKKKHLLNFASLPCLVDCDVTGVCQNGGTCADGECTCVPPWTGTVCDEGNIKSLKLSDDFLLSATCDIFPLESVKVF